MSESAAVFETRAKDIGVPEDDIRALKRVKANTYGQFAFICPHTPQSSDETPLKNALTAILGAEPNAAAMIAYRRLYFESHAIAASEMKSRLERSSLDAPRQMPMAERMLRLKRQQTALTGVIFDATQPPSRATA